MLENLNQAADLVLKLAHLKALQKENPQDEILADWIELIEEKLEEAYTEFAGWDRL